MQITSIKYRNESLSIILEDGLVLTLPLSLENVRNFSSGDFIDNELLEKLKGESSLYLCKQRAMGYLARGNKSVFEIRNYLKKKEFSEQIIKQAVKFLQEKDYLNDYSYAVKLIEHIRNSRVVGICYIRDKLYKKGISKDIINKAITETEAGREDLDQVYQLALKKIKMLENKKNKEAKLVYFLKARGFNDAIIYKVLEKVKSELTNN